jgi:hypothetical protein
MDRKNLESAVVVFAECAVLDQLRRKLKSVPRPCFWLAGYRDLLIVAMTYDQALIIACRFGRTYLHSVDEDAMPGAAGGQK